MAINLVILDRDGVINEDSDDYIKSPEEWRLIPGSDAAIAKLNQHGFTIAVATNQSGVARKLYNLATLTAIHEKMNQVIAEAGGKIDFLVYCPHGPDDDCDCRKPRPGLLQQIAKHYGVSLKAIPVIGDSLRDLQAAHAVGALAILVRSGKGEKTLAQGKISKNVPVYNNLADVAAKLIEDQIQIK